MTTWGLSPPLPGCHDNRANSHSNKTITTRFQVRGCSQELARVAVSYGTSASTLEATFAAKILQRLTSVLDSVRFVRVADLKVIELVRRVVVVKFELCLHMVQADK